MIKLVIGKEYHFRYGSRLLKATYMGLHPSSDFFQFSVACPWDEESKYRLYSFSHAALNDNIMDIQLTQDEIDALIKSIQSGTLNQHHAQSTGPSSITTSAVNHIKELYDQALELRSKYGTGLPELVHTHKPKEYVGLTDTFMYCEDCGEKL